MIDDVRNLMDQYLLWLKEKTLLREVRDFVEVTTPYLDRHNDYIQFYVKQSGGGYLLTDDGHTIEDLRISGCEISSKKRQELLRITLNGFGVTNDRDSLTIKATPDNFNLRKHNLVQSMLAVNDMFYLAEPLVKSLFLEDVTTWLDLNDIRYTPNVSFTGKSGYTSRFEFVIPKSRNAPERILHTINNPTRIAAQSTAFAWHDTKDVRPPDSLAYALINDMDKKPDAGVLDALRNYEVQPVRWSQRDEVKEKLAA